MRQSAKLAALALESRVQPDRLRHAASARLCGPVRAISRNASAAAVEATTRIVHDMMQIRSRSSVRNAAIGVLAALLLGACASLPSTSGSHATAPAQPLERLKVAPVPSEQDSLKLMLAGQFALSSGDLPGAARDYSQAARLSDDRAAAPASLRSSSP